MAWRFRIKPADKDAFENACLAATGIRPQAVHDELWSGQVHAHIYDIYVGGDARESAESVIITWMISHDPDWNYIVSKI